MENLKMKQNCLPANSNSDLMVNKHKKDKQVYLYNFDQTFLTWKKE